KKVIFYNLVFSALFLASCKPNEPDEIIKKTVIDTALIPVSSEMPPIVSFPDNKVTKAGLELGRFLFYDKLLSENNTISCGTCHLQAKAFVDGEQFSKGTIGQLGNRNGMPTFNLMWFDSLFWDSRAARLKQLALMPIANPLEMNTTPEAVVEKLKLSAAYKLRFKNTFGDENITTDRLAMALEQFLMSMVSDNSRFDKSKRGEVKLTDEEKRGFEVASQKGCFNCHKTSLFTDNLSHNTGLNHTPDKGLYETTKKSADDFKFKTPSLRNVALTAPYMHDGQFATLEKVIEFYDHDVIPNLQKKPNNISPFIEQGTRNRISPSDTKALIAFLNTLTDYDFITNSKFSDPFK
ncbi:MAG: cytochrome-c peroxidase, partial [Bacteroidia bacterium]